MGHSLWEFMHGLKLMPRCSPVTYGTKFGLTKLKFLVYPAVKSVSTFLPVPLPVHLSVPLTVPLPLPLPVRLPVPVCGLIVSFQSTPACDRRTVGRTDRQTDTPPIAKSRSSLVECYKDGHWPCDIVLVAGWRNWRVSQTATCQVHTCVLTSLEQQAAAADDRRRARLAELTTTRLEWGSLLPCTWRTRL